MSVDTVVINGLTITRDDGDNGTSKTNDTNNANESSFSFGFTPLAPHQDP